MWWGNWCMTGPQTPSVFAEWGFGLQDYFLPSHSCRSKSEGAEVEVSSALVLINNNTRISRHYICSPFLVWFLSLALLAWTRLSPLLVPRLVGVRRFRSQISCMRRHGARRASPAHFWTSYAWCTSWIVSFQTIFRHTGKNAVPSQNKRWLKVKRFYRTTS